MPHTIFKIKQIFLMYIFPPLMLVIFRVLLPKALSISLTTHITLRVEGEIMLYVELLSTMYVVQLKHE